MLLMEVRNPLAERIGEVFLNGTWVANTNYQAVLSDVTRSEALDQVYDLNTIYHLAFHVNYYLEGLCKVFSEGKLDISDKFSFPEDFPRVEEEWEAFKVDFQLNARDLISLVNQLSEADLDTPFIHPRYGTNRRNLDALIEHAYYHLGQITLIKKIVRNEDRL